MELDEILRIRQEDCNRTIEQEENLTDYLSYCATIWDGIRCWPRSEVGEIVNASCPNYIGTFDPTKYATKICTEKGWWINLENNRTWTNYTNCLTESRYFSSDEDQSRNSVLDSYVPTVKHISQVGYSVSLSTLLVAFSILAFNKRLRCPRNLLHLHLFVSFIMRASMALLKDNLFIKGIGLRNSVILSDGEIIDTQSSYRWDCKAFTILWQYFIMANYSWILMEGIYLHNLIFMALFLDTTSTVWHVITGWTLPAVFVLPWAVLRVLYEDTLCWTTNANKWNFLLIKTPIVLFVVINLLLFINITRVLLSKLSSSSSHFISRRIARYKKWAKSTLVLMPLFGVHYALFLGMSYSENPSVEIVWLFCDQLFASSQGFCVALLYCILNAEVINEVKRKWFSMKTSVRRLKRQRFSVWTKSQESTHATDIELPSSEITLHH